MPAATAKYADWTICHATRIATTWAMTDIFARASGNGHTSAVSTSDKTTSISVCCLRALRNLEDHRGGPQRAETVDDDETEVLHDERRAFGSTLIGRRVASPVEQARDPGCSNPYQGRH